MVEYANGLESVLDVFDASGLFDWEGLDVPAVRAKFAEAKAAASVTALPVARVEDVDIAQGVTGRLYHPAPGERLPLLLWFHGGGWVLGGVEHDDETCRRLALAGDMAVVSVEYRLAPEHPFPAAVDDAQAALAWAQVHVQELGCGPVAVGGASAGGTLAAVVSLMARDAGKQPPAHQLLVYPATDEASASGSMRRYANGPVLYASHMDWFYDHYLPAGIDRLMPTVSPLRAEDHSGLPPATVVVAEHDPLHDEGAAYADRLTQAGVDVKLLECLRLVHGFFGMASAVPEAARWLDDIARRVGRAMGGRGG